MYTIATDSKTDTWAEQVPATFRLEQNEPNPFTTSTTIRFAIPESCHVRLSIYDRERKLVCILLDMALGSGNHKVIWNGRNSDGQRSPDGFYSYLLQANGFVATRKLEIQNS